MSPSAPDVDIDTFKAMEERYDQEIYDHLLEEPPENHRYLTSSGRIAFDNRYVQKSQRNILMKKGKKKSMTSKPRIAPTAGIPRREVQFNWEEVQRIQKGP